MTRSNQKHSNETYLFITEKVISMSIETLKLCCFSQFNENCSHKLNLENK